MNFSERLKLLRTNKMISQLTLANEIGITIKQIQRYEAGESEPTLSKIYRLADYFDVSADYLLGRSDDAANLSFHSIWEDLFRQRLAGVLSNTNENDMYEAGVDINFLYSVAYKNQPFNFNDACNIADELGVSMDYLLARDDFVKMVDI